MKVACLIREYPPAIYFLNRIHDAHPLSLGVVERNRAEGFFGAMKKRGVAHGVDLAKAKIREVLRMPRDYSLYFGNKWRGPEKDVPILETENINADEVYRRIAEAKPDVILVCGTSVLRERITAAAPLVINLHVGLSPYYRGMYCTQWALLNRDPHNIGVTIHKVTRDIDGGDIAAQKRVEVTPDDTVHSINMRIYREGTELALALLKKIDNGWNLGFTAQDLTLGRFYYIRELTPRLARKVKRIERSGLLVEVLENPSRKDKLPIVELGGKE